MSENDESIIFEERQVKITNRRVVIGMKTYTLANITSVSMSAKNDGGGVAPILFMLSGLGVVFLFLMGSLTADKVNLVGLCIGTVIGSFLVGLGIYVYRTSKPIYFVSLGSSSGEMNILQSRDKAQIQRIVEAMNEAIVRRG